MDESIRFWTHGKSNAKKKKHTSSGYALVRRLIKSRKWFILIEVSHLGPTPFYPENLVDLGTSDLDACSLQRNPLEYIMVWKFPRHVAIPIGP